MSIAPRKRARVAAPSGSASQPIVINTQPSAPSLSLSSSPYPLSVEALLDALQATTFESQLCNSHPEAEIVVRLANGSPQYFQVGSKIS
jgi:hypothetical protein